jgi:hypothetical protein
MDCRRWRHFSIKFLLGTITLICIVLASWRVCENRAISDVTRSSGGWTPEVVLPFVLRVGKSDNVTVVANYHVWCYGVILDLPYFSRYPETGGVILGGVRPRIIIQPEEEQHLNLH